MTIAVALGVLAAASCSVESSLPPPSCTDGDSAAIVAQSVPTASQIPCLEDLSAGWSVATVTIDQDGTTIVFDSDRAGSQAARLLLRSDCDLSGAVDAPSDLDQAERYDRIDQVDPAFRASRFYRFPGGCLWWEFDFDQGASATESIAIADALHLVPRVELNDSLRATFIDEDL